MDIRSAFIIPPPCVLGIIKHKWVFVYASYDMLDISLFIFLIINFICAYRKKNGSDFYSFIAALLFFLGCLISILSQQ